VRWVAATTSTSLELIFRLQVFIVASEWACTWPHNRSTKSWDRQTHSLEPSSLIGVHLKPSQLACGTRARPAPETQQAVKVASLRTRARLSIQIKKATPEHLTKTWVHPAGEPKVEAWAGSFVRSLLCELALAGPNWRVIRSHRQVREVEPCAGEVERASWIAGQCQLTRSLDQVWAPTPIT
jgi:hypothetical protein